MNDIEKNNIDNKNLDEHSWGIGEKLKLINSMETDRGINLIEMVLQTKDKFLRKKMLNMQDKNGQTLLWHALDTNRRDFSPFQTYPESLKVFNLCLENGANPNVKDNDGRTILHYILGENLPKTIRPKNKDMLFFGLGDILTLCSGEYCSSFSMFHKDIEMIKKTLCNALDKGADLEIKSKEGLRPWEETEKKIQSYFVRYLSKLDFSELNDLRKLVKEFKSIFNEFRREKKY